MNRHRAEVVSRQLKQYSLSDRLYIIRPRHEMDKVMITCFALETVREAIKICVEAGHIPNCSISGSDGSVDYNDLLSINQKEFEDLINKLGQISKPTP